MLTAKSVLILVFGSVLLFGCSEQYRYPCQDPANWESAECQKPVCEIGRNCPEHIFPDKFACGNNNKE